MQLLHTQPIVGSSPTITTKFKRKEASMPAVFLVSDTHFGHAGVCRFTRNDGVTKLRPWTDPAEMDEAMVAAWNERVRPNDKVYHLGDVVINRRALPILNRLNGDKVLIRGNHDIFKDEDYTPYFRSLRGYHVMNGMILSHIPVHPESLGRFGVNIHGHLHANRVMRYKTFADGVVPSIPLKQEIDVRYHCVCVEQTPDFAPILFEDVIQRIKDEGGVIGFQNGNGPAM
jgi:calcineurin-like phosphoesterase family protein